MALGVDDLIMGGVSAAGNLASSAYTAMKQEEANRNAFYDTLAADSTQYQRSVADLKAAGLNPMLAYMSSPDPTPNMQAPVFQNPAAGSSFSQGVSSAASAGQADASADYTAGPLTAKTQADTRNVDADSILKALSQALVKANVANVDSQTARNYQDVKNSMQQVIESYQRVKLLRAQTDSTAHQGEINSVEANLMSHLNKVVDWVENLFSGSHNSASGVGHDAAGVGAQLLHGLMEFGQ